MNQKQLLPVHLTTDIVVFCKSISTESEILLIQRKNEPFKDYWALPGGFFEHQDQNIIECAKRELEEETNLDLAGS